MFQHSLSIQYVGGGGAALSIATAPSGPLQVDYDDILPVSTTNRLLNIVFTNSKILMGIIYATGQASGDAVTILANSSSSPTTTLHIANGEFLLFGSALSIASPFAAADVATGLYVTNPSSSVVAPLTIRMVLST